MGIDDSIKKFLYHLFPECFQSKIEMEFDITIMDITHNLASIIQPLKKGKNITIKQELVNLKKNIYKILANDTNCGSNVKDYLILLLDNPLHVPGNKSFIQKDRDTGKTKNETSSFLIEQDYIQLKKENNCTNGVLFPNPDSNINIDGSCFWRD